jgi:hypothetical protein
VSFDAVELGKIASEHDALSANREDGIGHRVDETGVFIRSGRHGDAPCCLKKFVQRTKSNESLPNFRVTKVRGIF